MCDASDMAIGAVLGQREGEKPYVVYYASIKELHNHRKGATRSGLYLRQISSLFG